MLKKKKKRRHPIKVQKKVQKMGQETRFNEYCDNPM